MIRFSTAIAAIILCATSASGTTIVANITDFDQNPINDAALYVECRDNYFFSDKDGRVVIYVEEAYEDCVVGISHPDFVSRDFVIRVRAEADTTYCDLRLYKPQEPESIDPRYPYTRFGQIEICGDEALSYELLEVHGSTSLVFNLPPGCDDATAYLTLREDEYQLCGDGSGYNIDKARHLVFEARAVSGSPEVTFISLWDGCDSKPGTYPKHRARLSNNFTEFRMNLGMWKLSDVSTIWGFKLNRNDTDKPLAIEIKDIRVLFDEFDRVADTE